MSVWVCLRCGVFKEEGRWFECASCGYAPEDGEAVTRQLLAQDDTITPRLQEMARQVKAGEPVPFHPEEVRVNWTTRAEALDFIRQCEAIQREDCPDCGKPIRFVVDGPSCGWSCSACTWSIWTSNPDAVES